MRSKILAFMILILGIATTKAQNGLKPEIIPDPMTVQLVRDVGRDIFNANGIKYLQPVVETMNATSNSRFYNQAFVPKEDKFYFRFGVHMMVGIIPDNKKSYIPELPNEQLKSSDLFKCIRIIDPNPSAPKIAITDTSGLIRYAFRGMLYDGIKNGQIKVPRSAPTALGKGNVYFDLPPDSLKVIFQNLTVDLNGLKINLYDLLGKSSPALRDTIMNMLTKFPSTFALPPGSDISSIIAGIPQLEIGSFFGTELLLRYIPKINMGSTIGKFSFFGFGLKHSLSQYFNNGDKLKDRYFDLALQVVYQGTTLENKIGLLEAELNSKASFWDFNIHGSKTLPDKLFGGTFDIYSGFSYDLVSIISTYKTFLPITLQWELGLIDKRSDDTPNYLPSDGRDGTPNVHYGDSEPGTATIKLDDKNFKWVVGIAKQIGPISIFLDYNVSQFSIFTAGIEYRF